MYLDMMSAQISMEQEFFIVLVLKIRSNKIVDHLKKDNFEIFSLSSSIPL